MFNLRNVFQEHNPGVKQELPVHAKTIGRVMHDMLCSHESVIISDEICAQIMLKVHQYSRYDFSCRQKPKFRVSV